MRNLAANGGLRVRVIAGTHAVLLAMDVAQAARPGLLGFAIGLVKGDDVAWLRGRKTFASVVPQPDPKDDFSSIEQPIQSLIWSDYAQHPGTISTYRVVPLYGAPAHPTQGDGVDIEVRTENPDEGVHGIYFNRGAIASQAFAEHFQNKPPKDENDPHDKTVRWLSRGMLEATLAFIDQAERGDRLHVAAYEFTYDPVLLALKRAAGRGADVRIVHEAGKGRDRDSGKIVDTSATTEAAKAIKRLKLDKQPDLTLIKRTRRRAIPHNKFIVLVRDDAPTQVLAGSANFTSSGFLGQSNVVHVVRDAAIAGTYLAYWDQLATDPTTPMLSTWTQEQVHQDDLDAMLAQPAIVPFFSPRKNDAMLSWYADAIAAATQTVMFTAAFGVNKLLAAQFGIDRPFVRFILLEDEPDAALRAKLSADRDVLAAYGSLLGAFVSSKKKLPPSSLDAWFLKEELFRKEGHVFFIHTKFLLIDPLSDAPLTCTGSANFSSASLEGNDENMLLIRGDTAVADIYLTEFDRIFRHFYARQEINHFIERGEPIVQAKFLDETDAWLDAFVQQGRIKTNRQRLFFPDWPG